VIGPALTGFLVDRTGHFGAPVAIAAAMSVIGGCAWVFVVGRLEQIPWKSKGLSAGDLREAV
jgi:cyanate permease